MRYSQKQVEFLKQHYSSISPYKSAIVLGVSKQALFNKAFNLKLKAPVDGKFKPGVKHEKTQFKVGHVPFNKGRKITEWMNPNTIDKFKAHTFCKGNQPVNTKSDGVITIRHDKRNVPYKFIRISKSNWVHYHRFVWEQIHGAIPNDMLVVFKNGDTLNCEIENLQLMSKADNVRRNSIHNYPEEFKEVFKLMGKLKRKITNTQ